MRRRSTVSFTITLLTAFALLFVVAMGAVVLGYLQTGRRAALATAERSLAQAAEAAAAHTRALVRPVAALSAVIPEFAPLGEGLNPTARDTAALLAVLAAEPAVHAVAVGLPDGTLRQVLRLPVARAEARPESPAAALALREATATGERWIYLDAQGRPVEERMLPPGGGDHRQAQWYLLPRDALVHVSTLYDLPLAGRPGLTLSRAVPGLPGAVLGLDMTLDALAGFLDAQRPSPRGIIVLFNEDGILLAHPDPARAVIALGDGRSTWTTMHQSADPLLRDLGTLYAIGALAAGAAREVPGPEGPLLVRLALVGELSSPQVMVAVAAPVGDFTAALEGALRQGTVYAGLALAGGLLLLGLLAWRISRPLAALTREAEAIGAFALEGRVPVNSRITEIARLADSMDRMKGALRQFGVYVPRALVAQLVARGETARIGGERRRITVMFSDVQGFTTLAESMDPEALMALTSHYFQAVTEELQAGHATIDKYIGDAVMAIWNAPGEDASHALNACLAALRTRALTRRLGERFAARGWPAMPTRFGLHTGEAVVGHVGSTDRMAWTAVGSMVNLAARLEGLNKHYGTGILVSEATRAAAGHMFVTRPVDLVLAKGATQPMEIHELLGLAVVDDPAEAALRPDARTLAALPDWRRAVAAWRAGDFAAAAAALAACPPDDPLVTLYAARLAERREGADADWSPVIRFDTK